MYINLYQPAPSIFNPNPENCHAHGSGIYGASMGRADALRSRHTLRVARSVPGPLRILADLGLTRREFATCIVDVLSRMITSLPRGTTLA